MASEERVWGKLWVQPSQPDAGDDTLIVGSLWSDSDAAGGGLYICTSLSPIAFQQVTGGGGGATDHGALMGLADDDHSQYHNNARGDARYYTQSQVDTKLANVWPVGFVLVTTTPTNPGVTLGFGTWSAFGAGRVLVGLDAGDTDFDTVEETGGSKTV